MQNLCHYGILGMKWGVRKERSSDSVKQSPPQKNKKSTVDKLKESKLVNMFGLLGGLTMSSRGLIKMVNNGKLDCISILNVIGGTYVSDITYKNLAKIDKKEREG
ncbi:hypothetical protein FACS189490_10560 [Clostridia bacterium]|nr:hypothetical protein FACS189490_10560 [Clostridia bacterium]